MLDFLCDFCGSVRDNTYRFYWCCALTQIEGLTLCHPVNPVVKKVSFVITASGGGKKSKDWDNIRPE